MSDPAVRQAEGRAAFSHWAGGNTFTAEGYPGTFADSIQNLVAFVGGSIATTAGRAQAIEGAGNIVFENPTIRAAQIAWLKSVDTFGDVEVAFVPADPRPDLDSAQARYTLQTNLRERGQWPESQWHQAHIVRAVAALLGIEGESVANRISGFQTWLEGQIPPTGPLATVRSRAVRDLPALETYMAAESL